MHRRCLTSDVPTSGKVPSVPSSRPASPVVRRRAGHVGEGPARAVVPTFSVRRVNPRDVLGLVSYSTTCVDRCASAAGQGTRGTPVLDVGVVRATRHRLLLFPPRRRHPDSRTVRPQCPLSVRTPSATPVLKPTSVVTCRITFTVLLSTL